MPRRINTFNGSFRARCVVLLALALSGRAIIATAQSSSTFTTTGSMTRARSQHTATLLPNGKVLIAGGAQWTSLSGPVLRDCYVPNVGCILASAEVFDPEAAQWRVGFDDGKPSPHPGPGLARVIGAGFKVFLKSWPV